jgi:WD40 repeat protein
MIFNIYQIINTILYISGSVFCCDIDKTGQYAVTGGEDDIAHVWDLKTGDVKFTCSNHSVNKILGWLTLLIAAYDYFLKLLRAVSILYLCGLSLVRQPLQKLPQF